MNAEKRQRFADRRAFIAAWRQEHMGQYSPSQEKALARQAWDRRHLEGGNTAVVVEATPAEGETLVVDATACCDQLEGGKQECQSAGQ